MDEKIDNLIVFNKVTKIYDKNVAVQNLNLKIKKGKLTILIGPSGSGKTTTLKLINRLIKPTKGDIFIKGKNIKTIKPQLLRRQIGYVIQNTGLFYHMNVEKNISIVPKLLKWDKNRIKKRVIELLELVNLEPEKYLYKKPSELSGGEAQRIGVARALAADPDIMIMDEPFGALDPITRNILQNEFLKIQQKLKKTVVFVTHDIDEAIKLGDYIAIFNRGKIEQYDKTDNILKNPANKFVNKFIGSDKALKKLIRIKIKEYTKSAPVVKIEKNVIKNVFIVNNFQGFLWVIDDYNNLKGYLDLRKYLSSLSSDPSQLNKISKSLNGKKINEIDEFFIQFDKHDIDSFVFNSDSVKDALSKLINNDSQYLPVLDENKKFLGVISLNIILNIAHNN